MPNVYAAGSGPLSDGTGIIGQTPVVGPIAGPAVGVVAGPPTGLMKYLGGEQATDWGMAGSKERGPRGEIEENIHSQRDPVALDQMGFIATARSTGAFPDLSDDGILEWVKKYSATHTMTFQDIYHYGKEAMVLAPTLNINSRQSLELFTAIAGKMFVVTGGPAASIAIMQDMAKIISQSKMPSIGRSIYAAVVAGDTTSLQASVDNLMFKSMTNPEFQSLSTNLNNLVSFCISPSSEMLSELHESVQSSMYREQQRYILFRHTSNFMIGFFQNIADETTNSIKGFIKDPKALLRITKLNFSQLFDLLTSIGKAYNAGAEVAGGAFGVLPITGGQTSKPPAIGLTSHNKFIHNIRTAQPKPAEITGDPTSQMPSTTQPGASIGEARSLGKETEQVAAIDPAIQNKMPFINQMQSVLEDYHKNIINLKTTLDSTINLADATRAEAGRAVDRSPLDANIFKLTENGATMFSSVQEAKAMVNELGGLLPDYERLLGAFTKSIDDINNIFQQRLQIYKNDQADPEGAVITAHSTSVLIKNKQLEVQKYKITINSLWTYIKIVRQIVPDQWKASLLEQQFVQLYSQYNDQIRQDYPGIKLLTGGVNNNLRTMAYQISSIYSKIARTLSSPAFAKQAPVAREKTSTSVNINILRYNYMRRAASWWYVVTGLQNIMLGKNANTERVKKIYREAKREHKIIVKQKEKNDIDKEAITEDTQNRYEEYYGTEDQSGELPYNTDESTNDWVKGLTSDPDPIQIKKRLIEK